MNIVYNFSFMTKSGTRFGPLTDSERLFSTCFLGSIPMWSMATGVVVDLVVMSELIRNLVVSSLGQIRRRCVGRDRRDRLWLLSLDHYQSRR